MQTFLPYTNLIESAKALDNKRLNKQILEGYQILKVLSNATPSGAWRNHPAVLMWEGHEFALRTYIRSMAFEAKFRGIKTENNMRNLEELEIQYGNSWGSGMPRWFTSDKMLRITTTHKARLYIKDPIYYAEFAKYVDSEYNKPCCEGCNYYWPTHPRKKK
jgi:hypothetical protein